MDITTARQLRTLALFRPLSAESWARIRNASTITSHRRGDFLFKQGEEATEVCIVIEGWVHLIRSVPEHPIAEGVVAFTVTPYEGLCGISGLDAAFYNMSAVAATECRVLCIPQEVVRQTLEREPAFAMQVLKLVVRRMQHMAEQYGTMAEAVPVRLTRAILRLRTQFGETIPVTHRELAQMAWTTTESAIRAVRQLKQRGLLAGGRGQVIVRDAAQLAEYASHAAGASAAAGANGHARHAA